MNRSSHLVPVLQALFVTFLWSTSWVLIKIGLEEIPSLTFAGLRYVAATVCLLPVALARPSIRRSLGGLSGRSWGRLVALGILLYSVTQGAQFVGLDLVPSVNTVSLLLSFTPVLVAVAGIPLLGERPGALQWAGVAVYLAGAYLYLAPVSLLAAHLGGLAVVLIGVAANGGSSLLGRAVNREERLHPLAVTTVSMAVGSVVLLGAGLTLQGLPSLELRSWAIVGWLAVVNTAFAFTLWNHTLRRLSAMESSVVNNTMLIQIAVLAWVFLGERLSVREAAGLLVAAMGVLLVQLRRRARAPAALETVVEEG